MGQDRLCLGQLAVSEALPCWAISASWHPKTRSYTFVTDTRKKGNP